MLRDADRMALSLRALLREAPLFAGLTQQGFVDLASVLHERRLRRGEVLFHRGNPGISMVIVGHGELAVQIQRPAGSTGEGVVERLGPGGVTGEMSCIDPAPRSATVVAHKDSLVYELTSPALHGLYQRVPQVASTIVGAAIDLLIARLRETNRRITDVLAPVLWDGPPGREPAPGPTRGPGPGVAPVHDHFSADARPVPHRGPLDLSPLRTERGLTDDDLQVLLRCAPPQRYPDGALLCREGEPGSSCFIIGSGWVEVLRLVDGQQRVVAATEAGALLGHLALVDAGRRPATVRARGEAVVLELRRDDFARLLSALSPLAMRFQEQVAIAGIRQLRMAIRHLDAALLAARGASGMGEIPGPDTLRALKAVLHEWYPYVPAVRAPSATSGRG